MMECWDRDKFDYSITPLFHFQRVRDYKSVITITNERNIVNGVY